MSKNKCDIKKKICSDLLKTMPQRQKEVIERRFGLAGQKQETLESIGREFGVSRERVRQIEEAALSDLKLQIKKYGPVFQSFKKALDKKGSAAKEEDFLKELGGEDCQNEVCFLLNLDKNFKRIKENNDFYALWTTDEAKWKQVQKTIKSLCQKFKQIKKPLLVKDIIESKNLSPQVFAGYLNISKKIQKNNEGFWGLKEWPEINPRRIKDKAYLVFKKQQGPLHFTRVAGLIGSALPQTVHNELIKDNRFVLVGRGTYALREWGYKEGVIKDILYNILKEAGHPLKKEEILKKALEQRVVKENTVFLNLSNKQHFSRTSDGHYTIKEA